MSGRIRSIVLYGDDDEMERRSKMKWLLIPVIVLAVLLLTVFAMSVMGYHRILVESPHREWVKTPRFARAGSTVTISTFTVDDADMYVRMNGSECVFIRPGEYQFVMPDQTAEIEIVVVSNGLA